MERQCAQVLVTFSEWQEAEAQRTCPLCTPCAAAIEGPEAERDGIQRQE